ncbi:hypothetical protein ACOZ4I_13440 [Haloarcula salina]|uniref:hypothetical protein n=1 Tax=Haloarcula salina TaxID=1429914 RepID=UPI003C6FDAD5
MFLFQVQLGAGLLESVGQIAALAGTLVLVLLLVALGAFAYKSLTGDGIRWPDESEETPEDDGVTQGGTDDEWKYY